MGAEYCAGNGNPLWHPHVHCRGPYLKDGYHFGDANVGSVYSTAKPTQAPTHKPTNPVLRVEELTASIASLQAAFDASYRSTLPPGYSEASSALAEAKAC